MKSLLPREHGAYVQLLAPLAAALLMRSPSASALLLTVAAVAMFLGSEALIVARGGRGSRRLTEDGFRARKRVRSCGVVATAAGVMGAILAPTDALEMAALVLLPAALVLRMATTRRLHTRLGELIAAVALAGAAAPVAVASGVPKLDALVIWLAWSAGFATTVLAVHSILGRHRHTKRIGLEVHAGMLVVLAAGVWMSSSAIVALPLAIASLIVALIKPSAKQLTRVGIAASVAAATSVGFVVLIG